ncbi:unnamed protein product [Hermetia illucens]|uniref:Major facilitator superfamily (MFS) profile domain-containing protein n=1 Tax=Hermetia illucens TaxID=343691 RepID=A0A7R8YYF3_HERIL|nr:synaptic vesicle glycoprotein 2C-like isoform X3 [Hermetia illucens]CAD7090048.1 unnamed protein product [Hermetia illucens]
MAQLPKYGKDTSAIYSFDEAMALVGNGKFQSALLLITGICLLSVIVETGVVGFYAIVARCDLGFTTQEQGILSSAAYAGIVIGSYPWGYLSDTIGRLKVIKIATIGGLIASIISAFSNSVGMLIAFRLIVGIFIAGTQGSVFSYLGEFHSIKTRTKAVTLLSAFVTLGFTFTPALAIGILPLSIGGEIYGGEFSSWRLYGILATIPSIIGLIILPFLPESPKYLLTVGKSEEALEVLRLLFRINKGLPKEEFPVHVLAKIDNSAHSSKEGFIGRMKQIVKHTGRMFERSRILVSLNLLFQMFGIYLVSHGLYMWFPNILAWMVKHIDEDVTVYDVTQMEQHGDASNTTTNTTECNSLVNVFTYEVLTVMGLVYTASYIVIGLLIKTIGKRMILGGWLLACGIAGIALYWARGFYLCAVLFIIFIGTGNCGGIVCTISVDYFPTEISALAMCLIMLIGRLGVVVGSNIYGLILEENCNILFYGLGSLVVILAILAMFLPNDKKQKKKTKDSSAENGEIRDNYDTRF